MKATRYMLFPALITVMISTLWSCSDYNQVVKNDDYDRKLELANEFYDKGQVTGKIKKDGTLKMKPNTIMRSVTLYEQIYQRSPKSNEGELSYFRIGKAYYLAGDYVMAGYYLGMFPQRFPYSVKGEESLFLSAMCGVQNSPSYRLDQAETENAIFTFQQFIDRYPNSTLIDSCNRVIDRLRFKLERKEYENVKLYAKTEKYGAAVTTALTFLDDFPISTFREEVNYLLVKNSYELAKNSVSSKKSERIDDTIERYRNFVATFPDSEYIKFLDGYVESMEKERATISAEK